MPAQFRVVDCFLLEDRQLFVLCGEIIDGVVRPGMSVHVALDSATQMHAPIAGVESIRSSDPHASVGLAIHYEDDLELAMWEGLNIGGRELLEIADAVDDGPAEPDRVLGPKNRLWWRFW